MLDLDLCWFIFQTQLQPLLESETLLEISSALLRNSPISDKQHVVINFCLFFLFTGNGIKTSKNY